jgi:hypothetical protein
MSAIRLRPLSAMFAAAFATFAFAFAPATAADPNPTPDPDLGCLLPQASTYCTGYQKGPDNCRGDTIPAGVPGSTGAPGSSTGAPGSPGGAAAPGAGSAPPPLGAPHNSTTGRGPCAGGPSVIPGSTNPGGSPGAGIPMLPGLRLDQQSTAPTGGGGVRLGQIGQPNR